MNELIKITREQIGSANIETVDARELHKFLESKQDFSTWIKKRIADLETFKFKEGVDFIRLHNKMEGINKGTTAIEYHLSIKMGQHVGMLERNEKGHEVREYFIACENKANRLPASYKEALLALAQEVGEKEELQAQIEADKPKVDFAMDFKATENSVDITQFSKRLGAGRNIIFQWMRKEGYLVKGNLPSSTCIKSKLLEVDVRNFKDIEGKKRSYDVVMVTAKGQTYFWNKYTV